jgi:hypothetical protein
MKNQNEEMDESVLQIDEHRLDRECKMLPSQYGQASFSAVNLGRDVDELKAELSVREAELSLDIRRAPPTKYGLEKYSEAAIKELILLDPKVRELELKIRRKDHKREMFQKLASALDMKKHMLKAHVELHTSGYFAQVRPSEEGREKLKKISRDRLSGPIKWNKKDKED